MDQQNPTLAKIPILDTGKFEQWQFRIQQYLQHEHYALWEVIEFGDSYEIPTSAATTETASDGTGKKSRRTVTMTTEDIQKRKNDVKARTTLLLSLPDEHPLRFTEGSKTLEQTFNRLQVIVGQLQFMDVEIEQDDLNQKFLTSLAPEWLMHMIVWRNRSDLDTMSLDDLRNEDANTASVSTTSTNVSTACVNIRVASISQDTACAYIASQSSGSQIKFEDINQINEDDMEEMDIKWNMALLSMRVDKAPISQDRGMRDNYRQGSKVKEQAPKALMAIDRVGWDWSYMANDEENHALVADKEALTEFALMANTSAESKVFDNSLCSKDCKENTDSLNRLAQLESRLVKHKDREIKYCEKIRGLELDVQSKTNNLESSKDLDSLLESQRLDKNKEGLGYSVVPPPSAQIYFSPKKDMSWTGLPEFMDDTVTNYSRHVPTVESSPDDA
nr:hypothetical protein [Tanacetum cinerariifolium]